MHSQIAKAWISKTHAAKRLGIRKEYIDALITKGLLRTVNLNGRVRVVANSLEKLATDPPPVIRTEVA